MNENRPANLNALIELTKGTSFESVAGDERKLEELLLKQMRASDDPMTREIGAGIADGSMTWRTVASTSAYAEYIDRGVRAMAEFDFGAVFDAMAAEQAENASMAEDDEDEVYSLGNDWGRET